MEVTLLDDRNHPLENAVVMIILPDSQQAREGEKFEQNPNHQQSLVMDQINRQFSPFVLPVYKGQWVVFPNNDRVRHHVYSFSRAKRFEIKLYAGIPSSPVQFDTSGIVVLGCNIHDAMLAYIYVSESPLFAKSDEYGKVNLETGGLNPKELLVWHPILGNTSEGKRFQVPDSSSIQIHLGTE